MYQRRIPTVALVTAPQYLLSETPGHYVDIDLMPRIAKLWWFGYSKDYQRRMGGFADCLFAGTWAARLKGALSSAKLLRRSDRI